MRIPPPFAPVAAFLLALSNLAYAEQHTPFQNPDPAHYLFEDQIQPGMKGYGLTVMHGGKIEKFDVEVIDVIRDFSPDQNGILVRCSGLGLEHAGIIAGMSGSPVYIDGKMIGAVAFGWGLAKDPIAGVQPIRNMLAIPTKTDVPADQKKAATGPTHWTPDNFMMKQASAMPGWSALAKSLSKHSPSNALRTTPHANPLTAMRPLASPLMVGNASPSTLDYLTQAFASSNMVPIAAGSAGATATTRPSTQPDPGPNPLGGINLLKPNEIKLEPGSAIAVPLVTGDLDLSAIGTVTEVRDNTVYAFGHAFMADGGTRLPIATSYIYTIMPNLNESFKVGISMDAAGTLVTDEQTGIVGILGKTPDMVPVTITVKDPDGTINKTYHYQLAPYPRLMPEVLGAALNETLVAQRGLPHQFTLRITGRAEFNSSAGPTSVNLVNLATTDSYAPVMTLLPVTMLADNPFENLEMKSLTITAELENTNQSGQIRGIHIDRTAAAPGDEIHATIDVTPFQQETRSIPLTIKIPADCKDGDYELTIGSSAQALTQQMIFAPHRFDPQNVTALAASIQHILNYKSDTLYATLVTNMSGMAVGGRELNNLPPSRIALYTSDRVDGPTPIFDIAETTTDAGCLIEGGGETFAIKVSRHADRRYFDPKAPSGSGSPSPSHSGNGSRSTSHSPDSAPSPDDN